MPVGCCRTLLRRAAGGCRNAQHGVFQQRGMHSPVHRVYIRAAGIRPGIDVALSRSNAASLCVLGAAPREGLVVFRAHHERADLE